MTFYDVVCRCACEGVSTEGVIFFTNVVSDLARKNISCGNIILMKEGLVVPQELFFSDGEIVCVKEDIPLIDEIDEEPYERAERLFFEFYNSIPSKEVVKSHFNAKNLVNLSFRQIINNNCRNKANAALEAYIICASLKKLFVWNDKKWFWQSSAYPNFILFKEWIM